MDKIIEHSKLSKDDIVQLTELVTKFGDAVSTIDPNNLYKFSYRHRQATLQYVEGMLDLFVRGLKVLTIPAYPHAAITLFNEWVNEKEHDEANGTSVGLIIKMVKTVALDAMNNRVTVRMENSEIIIILSASNIQWTANVTAKNTKNEWGTEIVHVAYDKGEEAIYDACVKAYERIVNEPG